MTWRLAARFADELNLDGLSPSEVEAALPTIRQRCEEIGRDPADLRVSVHLWWGDQPTPGAARVEHLSRYRELGVARVQTLLQSSVDGDEALASFAADARAAGASIL